MNPYGLNHGSMVACNVMLVQSLVLVVTLVADFMVPHFAVAHRLLNVHLTLTLLSAARVSRHLTAYLLNKLASHLIHSCSQVLFSF